jgi:hypothetical protein
MCKCANMQMWNEEMCSCANMRIKTLQFTYEGGWQERNGVMKITFPSRFIYPFINQHIQSFAHLHIRTSAHSGQNFSCIIFSSANISSRSLAASKKSMFLAAASMSFLVFSMDFFKSGLVMYCTIGSAASDAVSIST